MRALLLFGAYFAFSAKKFVIYRINLLSHIGTIFIPVAINFFMWNSIIDDNYIAYSLPEMMMYLIFANFIFAFTCIEADTDLEDNIKSPKLGQKLIRPINFIADMLLRHFTDSLCKLLFVYMPIILFVIFVLGGNNIDVFRLPLFILTLFIAFSLNASFALIIGFMSFWLTEIWGISAIRNILTGLLSGTMFPLSIFSYEIQRFFLLTPFPYMTYIPAKVVSDSDFDLQIVFDGLQISVVWLLGLSLAVFTLYKNGIRLYTVKGA